MSGTVNISRDLFDHPAFKTAPFSEREAWLWIIMEASWKPRQKRIGHVVVNVGRGQLAASIRFMAEAWGWTAAKVQRFVERLKKLEMVSVETDTGVTLLSICNYDKFQSLRKAPDTDAIQLRYTSDTNEKNGEIREKEEAKASRDRARDVELALEAWASSEAVMSFLSYRRKSKAGALTLTGARRLASHLKAIFVAGGDPSDALAMAEERGWRTVEQEWYFREKGNGNGNGNSAAKGRAQNGGANGHGPSLVGIVAQRRLERGYDFEAEI